MQKSILILSLAFLSVQARTSGQGVQFVDRPGWAAVRQEAIRLNKYIFVDVYATWCVPCRRMDRDTYPDSSVARFMNDRFIPIRVQFDTSTSDDDRVKSWYRDAHELCREYKTNVLPTFLFFSPDGKLVYRGAGYLGPAEFLALSRKSLNPENAEFFTLLNNYPGRVPADIDRYRLALYAWRLGDRKQAQMVAKDFVKGASRSSLVNREKILFVQTMAGDSSLADSLARVFKKDSLDPLAERELCTRGNLDFMSRFPNVFTPSSAFFHLCYEQPATVDSAKGMKGWSAWECRQLVTREQLANRLLAGGKPVFRDPPWAEREAEIGRMYPAIDAKKLVLTYQVDYYRSLGDWKNWARYQDAKIKTYPPEEKGANDLSVFVEVNLPAWTAFVYCRDKSVLSMALQWSELAIRLQPEKYQFVDTRANLLYKLGRGREARQEEERAIGMLEAQTRNGAVANASSLNTYKAALLAMQRGEPTYQDQGAIWK